jgi:hypothetical protein
VAKPRKMGDEARRNERLGSARCVAKLKEMGGSATRKWVTKLEEMGG